MFNVNTFGMCTADVEKANVCLFNTNKKKKKNLHISQVVSTLSISVSYSKRTVDSVITTGSVSPASHLPAG